MLVCRPALLQDTTADVVQISYLCLTLLLLLYLAAATYRGWQRQRFPLLFLLALGSQASQSLAALDEVFCVGRTRTAVCRIQSSDISEDIRVKRQIAPYSCAESKFSRVPSTAVSCLVTSLPAVLHAPQSCDASLVSAAEVQ